MLKPVGWPISRRKRAEQQRFQALMQQLVSVVQIRQNVHVKPVTALVQAVPSRLLSRFLARPRRLASVVGTIRLVLVLLANVHVAPAQRPRHLLFLVPTSQLASVVEMIRVVHVLRVNVVAMVVRSKFIWASLSDIFFDWSVLSLGSWLLTACVCYSASTHEIATTGTGIVESAKVDPLAPEKGTYA
jgi:hypothetical protein